MPKPKLKAFRRGRERERARRMYIIFGAVLVVAAVLVAILVVTAEDGVDNIPDSGCRNDEACGPSRICAAGGCIIFLSSEHDGIWHDDVKAQLDAGVKWSPQKSFGLKLKPSKKCPAGKGNVEKPPLDKMTITSKVEVLEVSPSGITRHQQVDAKGTVWIDSVRLRFPPLKRLDANRFCGSDAVVDVNTSKDKEGPYADVSLKQAAPAGAVATAAVALRVDPPTPDAEGISTLSFVLEAVFGDADVHHTVLAIPLGSEVLSLDGPMPMRQRLLLGYVAYYFSHNTEKRIVTVRYKVAPPKHPLDVVQINP